MNIKKKFIWFSVFFLMVLFGCEKNNTTSPESVLKSITTTQCDDNQLRINVEIEFKKSVDYQIEYWKTADSENTLVTSLVSSEIQDIATLILLEADTKYSFKVLIDDSGNKIESDEYQFSTSSLPSAITNGSLSEDKLEYDIDGYILQMQSSSPGYITMSNMEGKIVWYQCMNSGVRIATFDSETNTISCILGINSAQAYAGDEIIVIDLYGNTLMNLKSPTLPPHHDIRRLPDGNILTVNFVPEAFDLTMYGGSAEEIVFGDGYTIYDMNGNIVEQWDCFQEISPVDDPTIMDQLPVAGDGVGFNFKDDWLHANSIHYDSEGNIYMTFNWRSELWKIERATGKVLYRIGEDGNVDISSDAYASGMHSVEPQGVNEILVFDNGTNREDYISRALLYSVNENTMSATLSLKVEFPVNYSSPYMGNVQILNDDLLIYGSTLTNFIVFTDFNGNVLRTISNIDFQSYRSIYIPTIEKL